MAEKARLPKSGNRGLLSALAGELGFEPRLTESESAVLPLNYSPIFSMPYSVKRRGFGANAKGRPDQADALLSSEVIFLLPAHFVFAFVRRNLPEIPMGLAPSRRLFYPAECGGREPTKSRSAREPRGRPAALIPDGLRSAKGPRHALGRGIQQERAYGLSLK